MVGKCIELFRNEYLTHFLKFISLPGDGIWIPVALTLALSVIFWFKKDRVFAVIFALAPLVGQVVKSLLKNFYQIPRPDVFGCDVLATYGDEFSFPSGHVIFITIFFSLLAYYATKNFQKLWAKFLLFVSLIFIFTISYSRIYLGAHWYLDVTAGYSIGLAIFTISIILYKYLSTEKQ